jgi:DNA-binding NtrC family response regulator
LLGKELREDFVEQGWDAVLATRLADAERALVRDNLDPLVVLSDMTLPDGNALDLLENMRARGPPRRELSHHGAAAAIAPAGRQGGEPTQTLSVAYAHPHRFGP